MAENINELKNGLSIAQIGELRSATAKEDFLETKDLPDYMQTEVSDFLAKYDSVDDSGRLRSWDIKKIWGADGLEAWEVEANIDINKYDQASKSTQFAGSFRENMILHVDPQAKQILKKEYNHKQTGWPEK